MDLDVGMERKREAMKYLFLFVLAAILLNSALVLGQEKDKRVASTRIELLRASGLEALYNLDYAKAQSDFSEIAKLDPSNPTGPQLLAARLWIKTLYESRRLQSSLYSSESFYTKGDDKVDPKIVSGVSGADTRSQTFGRRPRKGQSARRRGY